MEASEHMISTSVVCPAYQRMFCRDNGWITSSIPIHSETPTKRDLYRVGVLELLLAVGVRGCVTLLGVFPPSFYRRSGPFYRTQPRPSSVLAFGKRFQP